MTSPSQTADPHTFRSLLRLIARAESNDNYNAHFGNARNSSIKFTDMSIAEVLAWQDQFVAGGSPSSAVGRYQIINTTLTGLVNELNLDPDTKYDATTQDMLASALLKRRGVDEYVSGRITSEQFAANLAMEWAALPRITGDRPEVSYYAGDGLNASRVNSSSVLQAVQQIAAL